MRKTVAMQYGGKKTVTENGSGTVSVSVTTKIETDETLSFVDGVLSVNTTDAIEAENDLPVTSAAVAEKTAALENRLDMLEKPATGENGATFTPSVSDDGTLSWTNDKGLVNPAPVNIMGSQGPQGETGATFTPSVAADGTLSWTNDKGLDNPDPVNIMGPAGPPGGGGSGEGFDTYNPTFSGYMRLNPKTGASIGNYSTAVGYETEASGIYSSAEGLRTVASSEASHAEGFGTIAASSHQHVQGKYNVADDAGKYAHIVGNGRGASALLRSNAHTLDWQGNAWFKGDVYTGGTGQDHANAKKLATEDYVDKAVASGGTGGGGVSDEAAVAALIETDMLPSITDVNGTVLTDAVGNILLYY